jgi:hypothetical protein
MNADAAAGVSTDVALGAKTGVLLPIGLGLAGVGIVLFAGGIALVVSGSSGRRGREATPPGSPGHSASPLSVDRA